MKRLLSIALLGSTVIGSAADKPTTTIYWNNGDQLTGQLVSATESQLVWDSSLFSEPFKIGYEALKSVTFTDSKKQQPDAPTNVRLFLSNGDVVTGTLISINTGTVALRSPSGGDLKIHRKFIHEIAAPRAKGTLYLGPNNLAEWKLTYFNAAGAKAWKLVSGNRMTVDQWNSTYLKLNKKDRLVFEVELSSERRPQFAINFDRQSKAGLRLETWGDEVVLVDKDRYIAIDTLTDETRHVNYSIYRDLKNLTATVTNTSGRVLGTLELHKMKSHKRHGFFLHNKGYNLTLEHLRIKEWDKIWDEPFDPTQSHLVKIDGSVVTGNVTAFSPNTGFLIGGRRIPLSEVGSIRIAGSEESPPPSTTTEVNQVTASWINGNWVTGQLLRIDEKERTVSLTTTWSDQEVTFPLHGTRSVLFTHSNNSTKEDNPDLFRSGTITLRGKIEGGDTGADQPPSHAVRWRPEGAINSSAVATDGPVQFLVNFEEKYLETLDQPFADRLFLTNNDIVSAHLNTLDEDTARFSVDFSDTDNLHAEHLRAIELVDELSGENDEVDRWRVLTETDQTADQKDLKREDEGKTLTLAPNVVIGHPTILSHGDEVFFDLDANQRNSFITVALFATTMERDFREAPVQIGFYLSVDRLYLQADMIGGARNFNCQAILKERGKASIRLSIAQPEMITIYVNDVKISTTELHADRRLGRGMIVSNVPDANFGSNNGPLKVSHLSAKRSRGTLPIQPVNTQAKNQLLTVPRFLRNRIPSHALIARNGDLLRGRFETLTKNRIAFESKLERFTFPRERVSSIVWLKAPVEDPILPVDSPIAPFIAILNDQTHLSLEPSRMDESNLFGYSELFGECQIDRTKLSEIQLNQQNIAPAIRAYNEWQLTMAPEPVLPTERGSGQPSELIGKPAPQLKLPLLSKEAAEFDLEKYRGKVVVLDFWATWCAPCIRAIPDYLDVISSFEESEVIFLGVNQAESAEAIDQFLKRRQWPDFPVVLDSAQAVGAAYDVNGLPHTVIVGPDGNVAWEHTGFRPETPAEMKSVIQELLAPKS